MKNLLNDKKSKLVGYSRSVQIWENVQKSLPNFNLTSNYAVKRFIASLKEVREIVTNSNLPLNLRSRENYVALCRMISNKMGPYSECYTLNLVYRVDKNSLAWDSYLFGSEYNHLCEFTMSHLDIIKDLENLDSATDYTLKVWDYLSGKSTEEELLDTIREELWRLSLQTRNRVLSAERLSDEDGHLTVELYLDGVLSLSEFSEREILLNLEQLKDDNISLLQKHLRKTFDLKKLRKLSLENDFGLIKIAPGAVFAKWVNAAGKVLNEEIEESVSVNTHIARILEFHTDDSDMVSLLLKLKDKVESRNLEFTPAFIQTLERLAVSETVVEEFVDLGLFYKNYAERFVESLDLSKSWGSFYLEGISGEPFVKISCGGEFSEISLGDSDIILTRIVGGVPRQLKFEDVLNERLTFSIAKQLSLVESDRLNEIKFWLNNQPNQSCRDCLEILAKLP